MHPAAKTVFSVFRYIFGIIDFCLGVCSNLNLDDGKVTHVCSNLNLGDGRVTHPCVHTPTSTSCKHRRVCTVSNKTLDLYSSRLLRLRTRRRQSSEGRGVQGDDDSTPCFENSMFSKHVYRTSYIPIERRLNINYWTCSPIIGILTSPAFDRTGLFSVW